MTSLEFITNYTFYDQIRRLRDESNHNHIKPKCVNMLT